MYYKVNGGDITTDYFLACNLLKSGNLEVWEKGELIDTIDYETAKYEVARFLNKKSIEE